MLSHTRVILVALITALVTSGLVFTAIKDDLHANGGITEQRESAYERVMRTGTLRCGWFTEAPFTFFDENTKEYSGLAVDLAKLIASDLGLEIEFAEQINFATFPQDLKNRRYDMVCGGIFVLPRGGIMDYSSSFAEVPVHGYVRAENAALDQPFDQIDWANITIAGLDGEGATAAVQKLLPQADLLILPQLSSIAEMLNQVVTRKADIGFVMPAVFHEFAKNSPDALKQAELGQPLYQYAVGFGLPREEPALKALINNAIRQYTVSGELAALHKKYDPDGLIKMPGAN